MFTETLPLNVVQVSEKGAPIIAVGGVVLEVTATVAVDVHPLVVLVTVTV